MSTECRMNTSETTHYRPATQNLNYILPLISYQSSPIISNTLAPTQYDLSFHSGVRKVASGRENVKNLKTLHINKNTYKIITITCRIF